MKISVFLTKMQGRTITLFYVFNGFVFAVQIQVSNS